MDINEIRSEIEDLGRKLSDPEFLSSPTNAKRTGSRLQKLQKIYDISQRLEEARKSRKEAEDIVSSGDESLRTLAEEDIEASHILEKRLAGELEALDQEPEAPLPDDVIMEIRAGAGGEEAALFAENLFNMYRRFAESQKWKTELLSSSESELGGFKEVVFEINGDNAYRKLRNESGVHRIQRIPETEKQGRIHTSTASVAVLPKVEETEIEIRPQDLKLEFSRSSGAGGQNVNKVETAVRITHLPTGVVVASQEGRSQLKNRERAMQLLRSRLYTAQKEAEDKKLAAERKAQIGTADRSEKIRTYNVPQDRVTDHRINTSWHNIESIFEGDIGEIIGALESPKPKLES